MKFENKRKIILPIIILISAFLIILKPPFPDKEFDNKVLKSESLKRLLELNEPLIIETRSSFKLMPEDSIKIKKIKNVGLTFYSRNDGYTPGKTTRSGRHVYDGCIAVSHNLWLKDVFPGDLIFVKATNRWYRAEDTMHPKYTESRVDIYSHSLEIANSGSSRTDIIIVSQPK